MMGTGVLRSTRGAAAASVFPSVTADAQFWYYLAPGAVVEITEASGCVGATQQSSQRNERQKEHTVGGKAGATIVACRCAIVAWRGTA